MAHFPPPLRASHLASSSPARALPRQRPLPCTSPASHTARSAILSGLRRPLARGTLKRCSLLRMMLATGDRIARSLGSNQRPRRPMWTRTHTPFNSECASCASSSVSSLCFRLLCFHCHFQSYSPCSFSLMAPSRVVLAVCSLLLHICLCPHVMTPLFSLPSNCPAHRENQSRYLTRRQEETAS